MNLFGFIFYLYMWFGWYFDETILKNFKFILACISTPSIFYELFLILMSGKNILRYLLSQSISFLFPGLAKIMYEYFYFQINENGQSFINNEFIDKILKYTYNVFIYCDDGLLNRYDSREYEIVIENTYENRKEINTNILTKNFLSTFDYLNKNNMTSFLDGNLYLTWGKDYKNNFIYELKKEFKIFNQRIGYFHKRFNIYENLKEFIFDIKYEIKDEELFDEFSTNIHLITHPSRTIIKIDAEYTERDNYLLILRSDGWYEFVNITKTKDIKVIKEFLYDDNYKLFALKLKYYFYKEFFFTSFVGFN